MIGPEIVKFVSRLLRSIVFTPTLVIITNVDKFVILVPPSHTVYSSVSVKHSQVYFSSSQSSSDNVETKEEICSISVASYSTYTSAL